jgi:hypothetical protein
MRALAKDTLRLFPAVAATVEERSPRPDKSAETLVALWPGKRIEPATRQNRAPGGPLGGCISIAARSHSTVSARSA